VVHDLPKDYSKLPPSPPIDQVILLDPLLATGGTVIAALQMLIDWGLSGEDRVFEFLVQAPD